MNIPRILEMIVILLLVVIGVYLSDMAPNVWCSLDADCRLQQSTLTGH